MAAAIVLFVFGAVTAALSLQLPLGTLRMPGTGLFPLVLGLTLMGLAAGQGVRERLARPPAAPPGPTPPEADGAARRVAQFIGAVALGTLLLEPLGYVLATFFLMFLLLAVFGLRRWGVAAAIAAASALASWLVFVRWLRIPMPPGWIF